MTDAQRGGAAPAGEQATAGPAAESEADQIRRLMNALLSMLSHDLRTPLSAISGWLFLLESDKLDAAARKRALGKIKSNIDDQVQLIDDVLLLSRCKTGHLKLDLTPVSAMIPLSAALETTRPSAKTGHVELHGPVGEDLQINADSQRLHRVFELLLVRAVKNTPSGGSVKTEVHGRDGVVEISISDNGRGISAAALPFLLNPLARSEDGAGRAHGLDKGLLLAHALVEAHHGKLRIASAGEGMGASVTIELPASRAGRCA